jgi:hypothetical protein
MTGDPSHLPPAGEVAARFGRWLAGQAAPGGRQASGGLKRPGPSDLEGPVPLLFELLVSNLEQWELEDVTRAPGADDSAVAQAKRSIDRLNLERHRLTERIDAAIGAGLAQSPTAALATESPAMAFDRLTVLAVRLDRTERAAEAAGNEDNFQLRAERLRGQLRDLTEAIDTLLDDVRAGRRRYVGYEHLKLYGPAATAARRGDGTRRD